MESTFQDRSFIAIKHESCILFRFEVSSRFAAPMRSRHGGRVYTLAIHGCVQGGACDKNGKMVNRMTETLGKKEGRTLH